MDARGPCAGGRLAQAPARRGECGDGRFLLDASSPAEVFGVDASARALGHARSRLPSARLLRGSADALGLGTASFDAVTLLGVIEHLPDGTDAAALDEAHRVLRPGGVLVLSTNSDRSAVEWKHYRHYSVERFRALFDGRFADARLLGLVPYFTGLRFLLQAPRVWRALRGRSRECAPEEGQVLVGAATRR